MGVVTGHGQCVSDLLDYLVMQCPTSLVTELSGCVISNFLLYFLILLYSCLCYIFGGGGFLNI